MTSPKCSRLMLMLRLVTVCATGFLAPMLVDAASTDIANEPLITKDNISAKPNVMFILDSSGSMDSEYMPDDMSNDKRYGYWSAQCNGLAYNPNLVYKVPKDAAGVDYANSSFSAAWDDGFAKTSSTDLATWGETARFGTSSSVSVGTGSKTFNINASNVALTASTFTVGNTVTLTNGTRSMTGAVTFWARTSNSAGTLTVNVTSTSGSNSYSTWDVIVGPPFYYTYSGSQPAMGWVYAGSNGDVDSGTTFYSECMALRSSASSNFTKVIVTASSAEATNYANWYSYYRKRILLMRTAVGLAFMPLDSGYRIGFTSIRDKGITEGENNFRDVKIFDSTQKSNFYSSLYAEQPSSYTPLRGALSKVGRYFAKKIADQTYDPMEYSCQRNYAILSTDGYWNTDIESSSYGPLKLDGSSAVGNQDGGEDRPMYDGATAATIWSRTEYVVGRRGGSGCSSTRYRLTVTEQTATNSGGPWSDVNQLLYSCVTGSTAVNGSTAAALASTTTASTPVSSAGYVGGSTDSLADVAEYYYVTDLRSSTLGNCTSSTSGTSRDVCENSLKGADRDTATWQHMTTYTIGLGVSGTLTYDKNYLTQTSGSYKQLTTGAVNWPEPYDFAGAVNIDDLWHAAVNGRGQYYSALNADELKSAISGVVTSIQEKTGAASAASTNTLELVAGSSNYVYQASYTTSSWVGEVKAYQIDAATAVISSTPTWSAQALLDAKSSASRNIYFNKSGVLTSFSYANLTAGQKGYFDGLCSKALVSSQCSGLNAGNLTLANDGTNLVDYLRGDRSKENTLYRARSHVLGDIISSTPVYVGPPMFSYTDTGYAAFKSASASRAHMIYVGANDGMLHALYASGTNAGAEAWAFIPTTVMPSLYKLADSSYGSRHAYFVDGAPVIGDIYVGGAWKTILVGGLNGGGQSYYALDITTPESPILLWEFTNSNLGLSYGNPIIAKRADGTWVVALTSGYNNTAGDGMGHLFIVNANSGSLLLDISTGVGSSSNPSGLAKINAWIADSSDNTALRYYGGDLLGNLWRFDVDNVVLPHQSAQLLANFQTGTGTALPITIPPRLKELSGYPVVIVGTGRYLGTGDITDTTTQTLAIFKDSLTNSGWGDIRTNATMVQQTFTVQSDGTITSSSNAMDWNANNGWWFDFPTAGERIVTSLAMSGNTLYAGSALPKGDACVSGGASRLYTINMLDGSGSGESFSNQYLIVGLTAVTTSDGTTKILVKDSSGVTTPKSGGGGGGGGAAASRRTSWRELID